MNCKKCFNTDSIKNSVYISVRFQYLYSTAIYIRCVCVCVCVCALARTQRLECNYIDDVLQVYR